MTNAIHVLESMGANARFSPVTVDACLKALGGTDAEVAELRSAFASNGCDLAALLGGREKLYCLIAPAEDGEQPADDSDGDKPEEDDQSSASLRI